MPVLSWKLQAYRARSFDAPPHKTRLVKMALYSSRWPKKTPRGLNMVSRWFPEDPKRVARGLQELPTTATREPTKHGPRSTPVIKIDRAPQVAKGSLKTAATWPQIGSRSFQDGLRQLQDLQDGPNMALKKLQDGPKMSPRRPQGALQTTAILEALAWSACVAASCFRDGRNRAPRGSKKAVGRPQNGPKVVADCPSLGQESPKRTQGSPTFVTPLRVLKPPPHHKENIFFIFDPVGGIRGTVSSSGREAGLAPEIPRNA